MSFIAASRSIRGHIPIRALALSHSTSFKQPVRAIATYLHRTQHRPGYNTYKKGFSRNSFLLLAAMPLMTISDSVKDSLTKSEVVPTVIHDKSFLPKGFLTIQYDSGKEVALGNNIRPADSKNLPRIDFTLNLPSDASSTFNISKDDRFTLIVTDPDAPTRNDEKWSEYLHYLAVDVQLNTFNAENASSNDQLSTADLKGRTLYPYIGPGPPPKTGKHRYVFLLYKQTPGVTPEAPKDRPNWGTGIRGAGAAEYAEKYKLTPYAVNFFYAQNDQQ